MHECSDTVMVETVTESPEARLLDHKLLSLCLELCKGLLFPEAVFMAGFNFWNCPRISLFRAGFQDREGSSIP